MTNTQNTFDQGDVRATDVVVCGSYWDGSQKTDTLTTRNAGGQQRMPDKRQFQCVVIEGNGSRPSHHGDGYKESDKMFTLNTIDRHGVCYPKTTDPLMASGYQKNGTQEAMNDMYVVLETYHCTSEIGG